MWIFLPYQVVGSNPIEHRIDSLKKKLPSVSASGHAKIYNQLSALYFQHNPDSAYQYAVRARDAAERYSDKQQMLQALFNLGECSLSQRKPKEAYSIFHRAYIIADNLRDTLYIGISKGKMGVALFLDFRYDIATVYLRDALTLLKSSGKENDFHYANFLNALSYIFNYQGKYTQAIQYAKQALEVRRRIDVSGEMIARSFSTLGEFYILQGNLRKAMEYFNLALQINQKNGNRRGIAIVLTHISNVYLQEGNYRKALNNLLIALEMKKGTKASPRDVALTQLLIGKVYLAQGQPDKTYFYLHEALVAFEEAGDKQNLSYAYTEIAKHFASQKQFKQALQAHQKAIQIALEIQQPPLIVQAYEAMAQTYLLMEDANNFVKYYKIYHNGKDSIERELRSLEFLLTQEALNEQQKAIQQMEANNRQEQVKREQEKTEMQRNFFFVISLIAIVAVIAFGYLLSARIKYQQLLKDRNKIILQQNEQLHKQKRDLEELIATKDKLFSIVAHDIRTPLAGLSAMLELLRSQQVKLGEEEVQAALQQIGKSLTNVHQLLSNLLDWARLQTGSFNFEPTYVDLFPIVKKTVDLFEPQIAAKHIEVLNRVPKEAVLFADKNMLEFILRNVISNAVKFTFPDKKIIIEYERQDSYTCVRCIDQGMGLSEEEAEKIFRLTVSKIGTKGERGAGIALHICSEFMAKHGGRIWATPNPAGGSIFHIQFPLPAES
ncbi:MAG: tetratricopeptide repeat protein [Cytophagales bacterium]|nr:tetratricopeptide repeat protein [Bernardetiaceae bacterium]MDW8209548.1 tetratricopeptide repeat protein [Cytophagales bacterium]